MLMRFVIPGSTPLSPLNFTVRFTLSYWKQSCCFLGSENIPIYLSLNHRFIKWFGLEISFQSLFNPSSPTRDFFYKIKLRKALYNLTLNPCKDEASAAYLHHLFQCLTTFIVKNHFFMPNVHLCSSSLETLPLALLVQTMLKVLFVCSFVCFLEVFICFFF